MAGPSVTLQAAVAVGYQPRAPHTIGPFGQLELRCMVARSQRDVVCALRG
jgi:hypothetical protein